MNNVEKNVSMIDALGVKYVQARAELDRAWGIGPIPVESKCVET